MGIRLFLFIVSCCVFGHIIKSQSTVESKREILALVRKADSVVYDAPLKAIFYATQADSIARVTGDDSLIAVAKNRLGSAYWSKGDLTKAFTIMEQSLTLAEANGYELLMAKNLGNIGNIYSASGMKLEAIEMYKSELQWLDPQSRFRYFATYNNIGKAFIDINYPDSSLHYLRKAKEYLDIQWENLWSIYYFNKAETYFKLSKYSIADSLLTIAEKNAMQFNSERGLIRVYQLRAELLLLDGRSDEAVNFALKSVDMARATQVKELNYITYRTLSACMAGVGKYQQAYEYRALSDSYQDSLHYINSKNEIELATYINRKAHLESLSNENRLVQKVANQQRYLIWGLSTVVCLISVLVFALLRSRRSISVQKVELEKLNAFKGQLFSIVAHDLRSPVLSVSAILDALKSKIATNEDIAPLLPDMQNKIKGLQKLFSDLLEWGRLQMNQTDITKSDLVINELVEDLKLEFAEQLKGKSIDIVTDYEISKILSNRDMLHIILRNLLSNSIKYSYANSTINLRFFSARNKRIIEVRDKGVGLSKTSITKLLAGKATSQLGTEGETGSGLGMAICIDFIHRLGGQLHIESTMREGTSFSIQLPA